MIELLADSLVSELLIVQLICTLASREREKERERDKKGVKTGMCRSGGKKRGDRLKIEGRKDWFEGNATLKEVTTTVPSRSSMVFSSFATVLSANSARFSACGETTGAVNARPRQLRSAPGRRELTSFSLSFMTLISSSYLSSFSEYWRDKAAS